MIDIHRALTLSIFIMDMTHCSWHFYLAEQRPAAIRVVSEGIGYCEKKNTHTTTQRRSEDNRKYSIVNVYKIKVTGKKVWPRKQRV